MVNLLQLEAELLKIEKTFRRHGKWRKPACRPPEIRIQQGWEPLVCKVAEILNRIFYIRSLPACAGMFGPVRETCPQLLLQTRKSDLDKMELARTQFNQLVSDLRMLSIFSDSTIERIAM